MTIKAMVIDSEITLFILLWLYLFFREKRYGSVEAKVICIFKIKTMDLLKYLGSFKYIFHVNDNDVDIFNQLEKLILW